MVRLQGPERGPQHLVDDAVAEVAEGQVTDHEQIGDEQGNKEDGGEQEPPAECRLGPCDFPQRSLSQVQKE